MLPALDFHSGIGVGTIAIGGTTSLTFTVTNPFLGMGQLRRRNHHGRRGLSPRPDGGGVPLLSKGRPLGSVKSSNTTPSRARLANCLCLRAARVSKRSQRHLLVRGESLADSDSAAQGDDILDNLSPWNCTNPYRTRRDLLRRFLSGIAAAGVAAVETRTGSAQTANAKRPLAEKLLASKYLPEYYSKAADALLQFENLTAAGKSAAARDALTRAAAAICEGLSRLADDSQFWATLAELKKPIGQNTAEIKRLLRNLDEFLPEEEKALQAYMPPGPRMRLVSNLSLALSRFRSEPTNWTFEDLRSRVNDSRDAVCAASKPAPKEPPSTFFADLRLTGYALGVLGGAATIVINGFTSMALPIAVTSIVGGIATIIGNSTGVSTELKARKQ